MSVSTEILLSEKEPLYIRTKARNHDRASDEAQEFYGQPLQVGDFNEQADGYWYAGCSVEE